MGHYEVLIAENEVAYASVLNENLIRISSSPIHEDNIPIPTILLDMKQNLITKKEISAFLTTGGFFK